MTTPSRTLLGQLFPSWAFFDTARLTPTLQVRGLPEVGSAGSWRAAVMPPSRRWWHVVFNPAGTQTLAAQTLVEGWSRELTEHADAARTGGASLPLVMALAEQALAEPALAEPGFPTLHGGGGWQLRLIVMDDDDEHITVLYESGRLPPFVTRVAK